MNLEQSKLTVNGTFNCNGGLLWEKAICSQGCQCIDHEVLDASVPRMLHLSNVLQLVIDGFDDGSLSKQELVGNAHQGSLHVVLQFGYQLYPVHKETLKQILADISFVTDKFSIEHFHEGLVVQRLSVVNITWCNHEVQQLTFLITNQMKFEAEEPSHGAFAPLGYSLESLVYVYTLVTAYPKRCAVYKTDSRALTQKNLLDKYGQRYGHLMLKFDKAVIGDYLWEQMPQVLTYMLQVKMLQAAIARTMEQNHDNHYLSLRQCRIPVIFALILGLYRVFFHLRIKNFAEIICHTINFSNFVLGDHSDFCLYFFVFQHYKVTTNFANHQIYKNL